MLRYIPLIFKNALRSRRRTILTICSVAASMCLLGTMFAIYRALFLSEPSAAQALRLITYHRVSLTQPLPIAFGDKIRRVPGVRDASIWQWFGGTYKDARDRRNFFARFSVEPEHFIRIHTEYQWPEEQKQAFIHNRTGCAASRALADKFGWKLGERITLVGDIFPVNLELTLVAIFDEPERVEALVFNHEYILQSLPPANREMVGAFVVEAENAAAVPRISHDIDAMFANSPYPTKTESERAFALSFLSFLGNVKMFLITICAAVTFTILLVTANTMAMSVRERRREVGILKTLGYPNGAILGMILGEAAIIAAAGGVVGLLLASGAAAVVRAGPAFVQQLKTLSITGPVALFCVGFAMLVGVISSVAPAAGAARTTILDALRGSE
jgi:putative ABC transport system permease protein